jgi:hypothetical protein
MFIRATHPTVIKHDSNIALRMSNKLVQYFTSLTSLKVICTSIAFSVPNPLLNLPHTLYKPARRVISMIEHSIVHFIRIKKASAHFNCTGLRNKVFAELYHFCLPILKSEFMENLHIVPSDVLQFRFFKFHLKLLV